MLKFLKIKNIAIINESKIEFEDGFNCLTGETGAGKSIIIDSLNFVLGAKADKNLINSKSEFAQVDAVFEINPNNKDFIELLNELDIEQTDEIQISRILTTAGKNTFKINGDITSGTIVKKLSSLLIDVFGQGDHQLLTNTTHHLKLLDDYIIQSKPDYKNLFNKLGEELLDLKEINNTISNLGGIGIDKEKNIELLNYQIKEISNSNLTPNEDEELIDKKKLMLNSEKVFQALNDACVEIESKDISNSIKQASNSLKTLESFSDEYSELKDKLIDLKFALDDVLDEINHKKSEITYSEFELNKIEDRLDQINDLKRKYGNSISDILNKLTELEDELFKIENNDKLLNEQLKIKQIKLKAILDICNDISKVRKEYSKKFEKQLVENVKELGLAKASFLVAFNQDFSIDNIESVVNQTGADKIEFLFSANLGQDLKPLAKVLSGGEMSRFILAFKTILSSNDKFKTFIFDEIDTGIGGSIGSAVGKKIAKISKNNQVLCITHLAQIACFADANFKIQKVEQNNKTIATVCYLNQDEKISEISRMVGVLDNNEFAQMHAKEIIKEANNYKRSI